MAFARPPLATLIARIRADLQAALQGTNAFLRRALISIVGVVQAGAVHGLYGFQQWIARQVMMDTCDADTLARWARILGKPQKAATAASGNLLCMGTNGTLIPADTTLTRSDGWTYTTTADSTIAGGTASVPLVAVTAGAAGDCDGGMTLNFASPIAGVNAVATVDASGLGGGADVEDVELWRGRVISRVQDPPKAGTSDDYVEWALEVAGITRAWPYPKELGPGTMTVRVMTDYAPDGPFPDAAAVAAVQAYLDSVAPVGCTPYAYAPMAHALNPEIHIVPDTAANRTAVTNALSDLLLREAQPGGTIPRTHFADAIGDTIGITDYAITTPADDVVEATGYMTTLGAITWV